MTFYKSHWGYFWVIEIERRLILLILFFKLQNNKQISVSILRSAFTLQYAQQHNYAVVINSYFLLGIPCGKIRNIYSTVVTLRNLLCMYFIQGVRKKSTSFNWNLGITLKIPLKGVLFSGHPVYVQGGSQKLLLTIKESIVSSSIFSGPPCM